MMVNIYVKWMNRTKL